MIFLYGLIRVTEEPQRRGHGFPAAHANIVSAVDRGVRAVFFDVVESDALLRVSTAGKEIAKVVIGGPGSVVSLQEEARFGLPFSESQDFVRQIFRRSELRNFSRVTSSSRKLYCFCTRGLNSELSQG